MGRVASRWLNSHRRLKSSRSALLSETITPIQVETAFLPRLDSAEQVNPLHRSLQSTAMADAQAGPPWTIGFLDARLCRDSSLGPGPVDKAPLVSCASRSLLQFLELKLPQEHLASHWWRSRDRTHHYSLQHTDSCVATDNVAGKIVQPSVHRAVQLRLLCPSSKHETCAKPHKPATERCQSLPVRHVQAEYQHTPPHSAVLA